MCDIGFRVQFNVEFPRQVMNFPIVADAHLLSTTSEFEENAPATGPWPDV